MNDDTAILDEVETTIERFGRVRDEIGRAIFGQERVIEEALTALLAGGHVLLVGVPGLAKTRLVETLGVVLGLSQKRVQFTPDLMPADILGSEVMEESEAGRRSFRFIPGPVFCQLLMADEINRASPRTQAALLQAMQERRVTVAGHDHRSARAVPRAGDPEPDRAGGHLSAARSAARPVPAADRRRLSGRSGGTAHDDRDHGRRHPAGAAGDDRAGAARLPGPAAARARSASAWSTQSSSWCAPAGGRRMRARRWRSRSPGVPGRAPARR